MDKVYAPSNTFHAIYIKVTLVITILLRIDGDNITFQYTDSNMKKSFTFIQIELKAMKTVKIETERPKFICNCCCSPINIEIDKYFI
jgi:hypothetical protein